MKLFHTCLLGVLLQTPGSMLAAPAHASIPFKRTQALVREMPIKSAIERNGAKVIVKEVCENNKKGYGAYFTPGRYPSITMCADTVDDLRELQVFMNHEAIHMAQWCYGTDSIYVIDKVKESAKKRGYEGQVMLAHKMASKYPAEQYDSEFEAYYYQHSPESSIIGVLDDMCKAE